ncbi:NUDIX domain-containing protein [Patescibacteria group bacterium]|nr:NUDIX domain-containing protein [Patescibacteria group bacterium]MBU1705319.1 NUDIX domain-containing protein [Patescibacteria group bacterium]
MIPDSAKKIFQGQIFSVWQWEQKMYDGSTEIFEGIKRCDTASIIAVADGKIIYLNQEQPHKDKAFGSLPCGRVDRAGESPFDAARRELLEETGYTSDDWQEFAHNSPDGKIQRTFWTYLARNAKKVADQNLDPGEKIQVQLLSLDEFLDIADSDDFPHLDIKADFVRAKYDTESRKKLEQKLFV